MNELMNKYVLKFQPLTIMLKATWLGCWMKIYKNNHYKVRVLHQSWLSGNTYLTEVGIITPPHKFISVLR